MRAQQAQQAQAGPTTTGRVHNRFESSTANLSEVERERLFQEFQQWQNRKR
jgi:hypothetical protein